MSKHEITRCPFCGRNWVNSHNYCPKNHSYSDNESLHEFIKVIKNSEDQS
jgi:uncharacterized OB-fold protein